MRQVPCFRLHGESEREYWYKGLGCLATQHFIGILQLMDIKSPTEGAGHCAVPKSRRREVMYSGFNPQGFKLSMLTVGIDQGRRSGACTRNGK